jgi:hypothetical protein
MMYYKKNSIYIIYTKQIINTINKPISPWNQFWLRSRFEHSPCVLFLPLNPVSAWLSLFAQIKNYMLRLLDIGSRSGAKKRLSDTECTTFRSWAKQHLSIAIIPLEISFLKGTERCFFQSPREAIGYSLRVAYRF